MVGLARELHRMGTSVRVISLFGGGPFLEELQSAGVPVALLARCSESPTKVTPIARATRALRVSASLARLWMTSRPDAVQAWLPETQMMVLPLALILRIRSRLMVIRGLPDSARMSRLRTLLLRAAVRSSTQVVANSRAALTPGAWPLCGHTGIVIPNAVSIPKQVAEPTRNPPAGVCVANFLPYKGHEDLLRALVIIQPRPKVTLIGTGPHMGHVCELIAELDLEGDVTILEKLTDPTPVLLDSQFFVLPSHTESLPNVVLEAMACGLPVVSTDVGGVRELLAEGSIGILVPAHDVESLAGGIARAAKDPDWRRVAGGAGRVRAMKYSWSANADAYLAAMGQHSPGH